MRVRSLTPAGAWTFGAGRSNYKRDLAALKQNIATRLRSWRGDCFFAEEAGVDYNNALDIGTQDLLRREVVRETIQTPGVLSIQSVDIDIQARDAAISVSCETIYGPVRVEV